MTADKETMKKSAAVLTANAQEATHLAKAQRKTADEQHVTAHKLEQLSEKLAKGAADFKLSSTTKSK